MDHSTSKKHHKPKPGLVEPGEVVTAEALTPAPLHSTKSQPSRSSQKGAAPGVSFSKDTHKGDHHHVSVEAIAGPATSPAGASSLQQPDQQISKEVDVEPKLRNLRRLSTTDAATKLPPGVGDDEDWFSKLIEYLWPKICKVVEDISWETVPRKLTF